MLLLYSCTEVKHLWDIQQSTVRKRESEKGSPQKMKAYNC